MDPAAFHDVVADGTADGIFTGEEFGETDIGRRGDVLDVLAIAPPAEVIDFFESGVGTLEEGDVLDHPIPGFVVGDEIDDVLGVGGVEGVDVMFDVGGVDDAGLGVCGCEREGQQQGWGD